MSIKQSTKAYAIIPARGGSKGIPRKNLLPLHGHPLIAFSIAAAKLSKNIDRVIVTTDNEEIATVARHYGAEVPFLRPEEISQDFSLDQEFFAHAVEWFEKNEQLLPCLMIQLRPTIPARDPKKIDEAIRLINEDPVATSLRSAHIISPPAFKMFYLENGYCKFFGSELFGPDEEFFNYPRQTLPATYHVNGNIDIIKTLDFKNSRSLYGKKMKPYILEKGCDIDESKDVPLAEKELEKEIYKPLFAYLNAQKNPNVTKHRDF